MRRLSALEFNSLVTKVKEAAKEVPNSENMTYGEVLNYPHLSPEMKALAIDILDELDKIRAGD